MISANREHGFSLVAGPRSRAGFFLVWILISLVVVFFTPRSFYERLQRLTMLGLYGCDSKVYLELLEGQEGFPPMAGLSESLYKERLAAMVNRLKLSKRYRGEFDKTTARTVLYIGVLAAKYKDRLTARSYLQEFLSEPAEVRDSVLYSLDFCKELQGSPASVKLLLDQQGEQSKQKWLSEPYTAS
ncbi:MAG: hypothetical protein SFV17_09795 [Candidatus Obscuribacter sp.]|nr:hypothetical protein [Candidatus Obscuribacter sp.]